MAMDWSAEDEVIPVTGTIDGGGSGWFDSLMGGLQKGIETVAPIAQSYMQSQAQKNALKEAADRNQNVNPNVNTDGTAKYPAWLMPVMIGVGVLALVLLIRKR